MKQRTIAQSDCDVWQKVGFIRQPEMTSSVVRLRRCSKALSQNQTCTKKGSWSLFHGLLLVWSTTTFLHLSNTITAEKYAQQIHEMQWKLQCPQPALVNRKGPILLHCDNAKPHMVQPMFQKLNKLGYEICLICYIYLTFHQPTTVSSSISKTFHRENTSTTSMNQKMLSKSSLNPEAGIFMLQE